MENGKKFFTELGIITITIIVLAVLGDTLEWYQLHPHTWWVLAYNLLLCMMSYFLVKKGMAGDHYDFHNAFIGNTTIRLLLSAILFLVYFLNVKENRLSFVITFFVFYFIYTVFEITSLLANLRSNSKRVDNTDEK